MDYGLRFFRDRLLDGRDTVPSYGKRGRSGAQSGEVDYGLRFFRDRLLDGRDTVPSYGKRGRSGAQSGEVDYGCGITPGLWPGQPRANNEARLTLRCEWQVRAEAEIRSP